MTLSMSKEEFDSLTGHLRIDMDKCKHAEQYKGMRRPTCNKGIGCKYCWKVYYSQLKLQKLKEIEKLDEMLRN